MTSRVTRLALPCHATCEVYLGLVFEGLERVETAVEEASEANGKNGAVVERWVKGIEERVRGLE